MKFSQQVMKLLADSHDDKSLPFNNFTDPCPELTKKPLQTMKVFDCADKKMKLPFGPFLGRHSRASGLPAHGYVPKTNSSDGRWVAVSGGAAKFIEKPRK